MTISPVRRVLATLQYHGPMNRAERVALATLLQELALDLEKGEPITGTEVECAVSIPVPEPAPGPDPRFRRLLAEWLVLHDRKNRDYSPGEQDYQNMRAAAAWGVPPWVAPLMRASEKLARLQVVARGGALANESVEDSLADIGVLAGIALLLWRERTG
jgi:hypothetical protein